MLLPAHTPRLVLRSLLELREGIAPRDPGKRDYSVMDGELVVGRMYNGAGAGGDQWLWTLSGDVMSYPEGFQHGGLADSREDAQRAFKARYIEWHRWRESVGRPWPPDHRRL